MNMETKFDSILRQGMPFLLFSPNKFKLEISNKLAALYNLCESNDSIEFNELYMQITDTLDNHSLFDSAKEYNIESFSIRSKSYDDRLNDHSLLLRQLKREIRNLHKKIIKKSSPVKSPVKSPMISPIKKKGINPSCPICGKILRKYSKSKYGYRVFKCGTKTTGCRKYFVLDVDNEFFKCEDCQGVLVGMGKKLICINCHKEKKVIE